MKQAVAGTGVGNLVFPIMFDLVSEQVGWRWSLRIWALIGLVLLSLAGILTKQRLKTKDGIKTQEDFKTTIKNRSFQLIWIMAALCGYGWVVPFFLMPSYASTKNISQTEGAILLSIMGGGYTTGCLVLGFVADKFGPFIPLKLCFIGMSLCTFTWPLAFELIGMAILSYVYGFFAGAYM